MRTNLNFKGFYIEIPYLGILRKMVENFDHIIAPMPNEPIGEEATINQESPNPDFQLEFDVEEEE